MSPESPDLIVSLVPLLVIIPFAIFMIVSGWKVYTKAGQPGWACLVPIYNLYIWIKIAGRPGWWIFLFLIPIVSLVISILVSIEVCRAFGKGIGFALLMIFLPFIALPILAFGSAVYTAPAPAP
ncbi:MAG TPA: DUF5684 domain-containing protein [Opitutaceae bacterium]|jgi:hypothetical protein|nr:hypothetical protein [Opitutaceae bacterium]HRE07500.1 DUF5684 domain-containing protein [Opitutaceae bacterium]